MTAREPLLAFSFYLWGRVNVLLDIADEVVVHLDNGFSGDVLNMAEIDRASSLMWLWSLAAYEAIRTICATQGCFSQPAQDRFKALEGHLTKAPTGVDRIAQRTLSQHWRRGCPLNCCSGTFATVQKMSENTMVSGETCSALFLDVRPEPWF